MYDQLEELTQELSNLVEDLAELVDNEDPDGILTSLLRIEAKVKNLRAELSELPIPTEA